jgi:pyruvate-formate lyase-activating enzyme
MLLASGVSHEFRTTVHPLYHSSASLIKLAEELQQMGVKHYVLQEFRPQGCADEAVSTTYADQSLLNDALCNQIGKMFENFSVRRA